MRYTDETLNSAAMDQECCIRELSKLLIVSPPRTGSSMLCRLLLSAGIVIPHEYFNECHIRTLAQRLGFPDYTKPLLMSADSMSQYFQKFLCVRSRDGVFVTKFQHKQYRLFLQNKIDSTLFDGAHFIYLTRKNLLAQAVSWHFAELTGRWGFEKPNHSL